MTAFARLHAALGEVFGDRVSNADALRRQHATDEGHHEACLPDLVAFPLNTGEVASAVRLSAAAGVPIVPWGAGTSLEGNALAVQGGLCLDMSRMDAIIDVRPGDLTATVQAGVRRIQLNVALRDTGLFFPIDPGADATLGGMAATRASGTNAVRYGTMRHSVLSCVVVLADGSVIRTAQRAPKSAAGYDLTGLMVGSEGTLGVITELTVRLHPVPETVATLIADFDTTAGAIEAVVAAVQLGLGMARIELLDAPMMAAINGFQRAQFAEAPTLFVEFHGAAAAVEAEVEQFRTLVTDYAGRIVAIAQRAEDRARLWKARHEALYATRALRPGDSLLITDVCVPISRLAQCLLDTRADLTASGLVSTIAGHVGDGNFHAFVLFDPTNDGQRHRAEDLHEAMARRAIAMEGTCTGEHGVGLGKRGMLVEELGAAVPAMAAIKAALDPNNILNPGKIFSR